MKVQELLSHPNPDARGWTRWWWYGCAITREDISAQLTAMSQAHIGGVEVQVTYPLESDRKGSARHHIQFFSPEFFEIILFTVETADKLGIAVDLTLGSGWPFGGPFVTQDMAPISLIPYSHDVKGPSKFSFDYTCVLAGTPDKCVLVRIEDGVMLPETAVEITDKLKPVNLYGWPWGMCLEGVEIPEGIYKIYTFVQGRYRQNVGIPAPGMEGYAIDHCRKDVCDLYFDTMGDTIIEKIGKGKLHGFFCDSIELGGNNWTGSLPDTFLERRGYDMTPYLPALWGDMGSVTPRVRYDYYKTFSELTLESFFQNFADRCAGWGVKARVQAHGIWADILKAYGTAHIPEGETFGSHDCFDVNTIHRRLAVSAGMVYGRSIVSNESFTWLRMPRFLVTPEMVKRAADAIFCDGINRIVNHGWAHSPLDAGKPGWPFYAGSMLSERNTWWDYYPALGEYIHRVSALMQAGPAFSEVAVYLPQADIWSESPMAELHMCMKLDQRLGHETTNRLQRTGFWFTYVNDEAIEQAEQSKDGLRIGMNTYRVVMLLNTQRLPVGTAQALYSFVQSGGSLLAMGGYPRECPGLVNAEENDAAVAGLMDALFDKHADGWRPCGEGRAALADAKGDATYHLLGEVIRPGLCSDVAEDLGFIRRDINGQPVYFAANIAAKSRVASISLPHGGEGFTIIDPLTGKGISPVEIRDEKGRLYLKLPLEENQSFVLAIGGEERPACASPAALVPVANVRGWSLTIEDACIARDMDEPLTWERFDETRYFCGEGAYSASFIRPAEDGPLWLRLTDVHCCIEVFINGESAGRLWKAPFSLEITPWLRDGQNDLRVICVNTWFNASHDPQRRIIPYEKPVIDEWPYFSRVVDVPRTKRIDGWRERSMVPELQPAGLNGPVTLCVYQAEEGEQ